NPEHCTLNPAPCTLNPAPCTLHPAPCTLHPAPCNLHPAPRILHPEPRTPNPEPRTPNPEPRTPNPNLPTPLKKGVLQRQPELLFGCILQPRLLEVGCRVCPAPTLAHISKSKFLHPEPWSEHRSQFVTIFHHQLSSHRCHSLSDSTRLACFSSENEVWSNWVVRGLHGPLMVQIVHGFDDAVHGDSCPLPKDTHIRLI
ncbi:hypothetical protein T484DRAFT_3627651, partial [Baffinella frigidus]